MQIKHNNQQKNYDAYTVRMTNHNWIFENKESNKIKLKHWINNHFESKTSQFNNKI